MAMSKSDIDKSKKKLGIEDTGSNKSKHNVCQANQCLKPATDTCNYCGREFCEFHSAPKIAASASYIWAMDKSDPEKFKKYNEDWQSQNGHPDIKYTDEWNKGRAENKRKEYVDMNKAYDKLFQKREKSQKWYGGSSNYHTNYHNKYRNDKFRNDIFYDKTLIKNVLLFSILLTVIATLPFGFPILGRSSFSSNFLISSSFLINFLAIFLLFTFYRKIASSNIGYWAGAATSILSSIILLNVVNFTNITNVLSFLEVLVLMFIASYASGLLGKGLLGSTYNRKRKILIYSGRTSLIFIAILIIASLSLHLSSSLKAIDNASSYIISNISTGLTSQPTINQPPINNSWAAAFFDNVSTRRGYPYTYCANLSKFAGLRFNTMASNYNISHYGYSQDFNSTWPGGVQVGDLIYTGFGEEVFYPSGYNASNYVENITLSAPGHWQELQEN